MQSFSSRRSIEAVIRGVAATKEVAHITVYNFSAGCGEAQPKKSDDLCSLFCSGSRRELMLARDWIPGRFVRLLDVFYCVV